MLRVTRVQCTASRVCIMFCVAACAVFLCKLRLACELPTLSDCAARIGAILSVLTEQLETALPDRCREFALQPSRVPLSLSVLFGSHTRKDTTRKRKKKEKEKEEKKKGEEKKEKQRSRRRRRGRGEGEGERAREQESRSRRARARAGEGEGEGQGDGERENKNKSHNTTQHNTHNTNNTHNTHNTQHTTQHTTHTHTPTHTNYLYNVPYNACATCFLHNYFWNGSISCACRARTCETLVQRALQTLGTMCPATDCRTKHLARCALQLIVQRAPQLRMRSLQANLLLTFPDHCHHI